MQTLKTFSRVFYFDKNKKEKFTIKWQTGVREFYFFYNDELIIKDETPGDFLNWKEIEIPNKGRLNVRFYPKQMNFEVKWNNYYLINSYIHSKKRLWTVFVALAIITAFTLAVVAISYKQISSYGKDFTFQNIGISALYFTLYLLTLITLFTRFNVFFYTATIIAYAYGVAPLTYSIISSFFNIPPEKFGFMLMVSNLFGLLFMLAPLYLLLIYFKDVTDYRKHLIASTSIR